MGTPFASVSLAPELNMRGGIQGWFKREVHLSEPSKGTKRPSSRAHNLSLITDRSPKVFKMLVTLDPRCPPEFQIKPGKKLQLECWSAGVAGVCPHCRSKPF